MKRGISLIAVLMFMMAATTASIVLFRWIGEENFASGSRLKSSEAYQASEAGLDATYSWLSFKAADVGALLSDYLSVAPSGRNPRLLNGVLGGQTLGSQSVGERFDVYLVGADTVSKPYKLKILSIGKGRDNSQISQTAIFKVDGLYTLRTSISTTTPGKAGTDYNEDFWGNMGTVGFLEVSSAVITQSPSITNAGGQALNSVKVGTETKPGYLVLDGDYYTNNGISIYGDLYSTGSFDLCASGSDFITGDVYIGGAFHNRITTGTLTISGSAYFADTINPNVPSKVGCSGGLGGTFRVVGNSTMLGPHLIFNDNGNINFNIDGSLVMDGNSYIDLGESNNTQSRFEVQKNATLKNFNPIAPNLNYNSNSVLWPLFGNLENSTLCILPRVEFTTEASSCANCALYRDDDGFYFKTNNATNVKGYCTPTNSEIINWGADPLDGTKTEKDYKSKLSEDPNVNSCDVTNTPIVFDKTIYEAVKAGTASWVHREDKPGSCEVENIYSHWDPNLGEYGESVYHTGLKLAHTHGNSWSDLGTDLQNCWNAIQNAGTQSTELYDGEWLVVYIKDKSTFRVGNALTTGKYIIINEISDADNRQLPLPPTSAEAQVMLYLPLGYPGTIVLEGTQIGAGYRYFIFSDGDIWQFNTTSERKLHGNVFMNNCAVMNSAESSSNPYFYSEGNNEFVQDLMASGVIQDNPSYTGSKTPPEGGDLEALTVEDTHIIPIGNRLKVELESKNFSKEKISSAAATSNALESSILVMPRIIFLPTDAFTATGTNEAKKLSDYYTFLYLNGATPYANEESKPNPNCTNSEGITLNTASETLPEGVYTCKFTTTTTKISDFYVQISGNSKMPTISLSASKYNLEYTSAGEDCAEVSINVENGANDANIVYSVGVVQSPATHNGWKVTQSSAVENNRAEIKSSKSNELIYTVCLIDDASDVTPEIKIEFSGDPSGCNINNEKKEVVISKKKTKNYVHRQDAADSTIIDCPADIGWKLEGGNCKEISAIFPYKNSWECDIESSVTLKYPQEERYGNNSCETSMGSGTNSLTQTVSGNEGQNMVFAASSKLKRYLLNVNKPQENSVTFTASNPHGGIVTAGDPCIICAGIMLYHGLEYTVEISKEVSIKRVTYNNDILNSPYKIIATSSGNVLKIEQGDMAICEFERDDNICPNIDLKNVKINEKLSDQSSGAPSCYFFSSVFGDFKVTGSEPVYVNGETVVEGTTDLSSLYTKDGGFYVYVPSGTTFSAGTYEADLSENCQAARDCENDCGDGEGSVSSSSNASSSASNGGGGIEGAYSGYDLRSSMVPTDIVPYGISVTNVCFNVSVTVPSSFGENRSTFIISCNASTSTAVSDITFTMGYSGKCYEYEFTEESSKNFYDMRIVINTSSPIGVGEILRASNVCISSSKEIKINDASSAVITCELLNSTADPHETQVKTDNGSKVALTDVECWW